MKDSIRFKKLPDHVKDAWFYKGKKGSVHIVLKPILKEIPLGNGAWIKVVIEIPQINLDAII